MSNTLPVVGDVFTTNSGDCVVTRYLRHDSVTVRFSTTGKSYVVKAGDLRRGRVKDYYFPHVSGVGFRGIGPHPTGTPAYRIWNAMLHRCYSENGRAANPSYSDVTVCKAWHNFQNFAEWYCAQPHAGRRGFDLDKDILCPSGAKKVYSPKRCTLVPQAINYALLVPRRAGSDLPVGVVRSKGYFIARVRQPDGTRKTSPFFVTPEDASKWYRQEKVRVVHELAAIYRNDLDPRVFARLSRYRLGR